MSQLDTYIVYLDDAAYAEEKLASVLAQPQTKRFILVACAPRMTRRIGKWLSHSARENWRDKWCDKLFAQFMPAIHRDDHVFREVANGPLPQYTQMLLGEIGHATVIDVRRPKFGVEMQPVMEPTLAKQVPTSHVAQPTLGIRPQMV